MNDIYQKAIEDLIEAKNIYVNELTKEQLASAMIQALKCGDFTRYVTMDNRQQVVYIPFKKVSELEQEVSRLKSLLESNNVSYWRYSDS